MFCSQTEAGSALGLPIMATCHSVTTAAAAAVRGLSRGGYPSVVHGTSLLGRVHRQHRLTAIAAVSSGGGGFSGRYRDFGGDGDGGGRQPVGSAFLTAATAGLSRRLQGHGVLAGASLQSSIGFVMSSLQGGSSSPGMRFWGLRGLGKKGEGLADEEGSAPSELVLNTGSNGDSQDKTSDVGLVLQSGVEMLPHPDKIAKGGEDAYFVSTSGLAVGVADGVGGWAEIGIDAGTYSRMLMSFCLEAVDAEESITQATPLRVLKSAHVQTKVPGSCTACIITLAKDTIHAANLGDSGFIIVRKGRIVFKSPQQQHDFNFPYQLGSGDGMSDPPEAAATFSVPVIEGDIIVAGTDGLFDNVFTDEIARVAMLTKQGGDTPRKAAQHLAALAQLRASDSEVMSPFGMAAQQVGFMYRGGKMDDITVLVSYVSSRVVAASKL